MDNQSQLKARNFVLKHAHKFNRSAVFTDRKKAIKRGAKAKHRKAMVEAIKSAYPTLKTAGTHWSKPKDPFFATGLSKKAGMAKAYARTLIKHKHQMVPPTHWMTKKTYGSSTIKKLLSQQLAARRVRSEGATQPRMASGALLASGSGKMDDRKTILKKTIMKNVGNLKENKGGIDWIRVHGDHGNEYHSHDGNFMVKQTGYHPTMGYNHGKPGASWWTIHKKTPDGDMQVRQSHDSLHVAKKLAGEWSRRMNEEAAEDEHLYHVTHTKHVAKIQKHGLKPMQTSNWVQQGNKERYGKGEVYAFSHKDDAHKWAAHMDWEHHKELGTGKISIIKLKKPADHKFDVDDSDPMSQAGKKGVWMKTHAAIHPSHIVSVEPYKGPPRLGEALDVPTKSTEAIAKKHGVSVDVIKRELEMGVEVEKEHTKDAEAAHEIARDHLSELPDYYTRLKKMEKEGKKGIDESAWQRKEGKSESGGLNKKGVESYRRENPGSKLQTAVTTSPSKLKSGSKAAKRRASFCSRMKGMKSKLTSSKTANDPDSRINKSLRKWNCNEERYIDRRLREIVAENKLKAASKKSKDEPKHSENSYAQKHDDWHKRLKAEHPDKNIEFYNAGRTRIAYHKTGPTYGDHVKLGRMIGNERGEVHSKRDIINSTKYYGSPYGRADKYHVNYDFKTHKELPFSRSVTAKLAEDGAVGAVNSVGGGNIAGMPTADPPEMTPVRKSTMLRRKKFAGKTVFPVDPNTYYKALLGKRKYEHYEKYLEGCDIAEEIREYGRTNWAESIIIQNEKTGAMVYLKYGSK